MPSLSPGTPGTKEAYGISVIRDDLSVTIPPKAFEHYSLSDNDQVLLATTHIGEGGVALLIKEKAYASVFRNVIDMIRECDTIIIRNKRAYALTHVRNGKFFLTNSLMDAFRLKKGDRLIVIKSTTVAMSYTPVEIWKRKFVQRGLFETVENMKKLEEF